MHVYWHSQYVFLESGVVPIECQPRCSRGLCLQPLLKPKLGLYTREPALPTKMT